MEPIKIYNYQLSDLIALGKLTQNEAYDILETHIFNGAKVMFFQSLNYPNDSPLVQFDNIESFKKWRKDKEDNIRYLEGVFGKK